jgi:mannose-1-phosphate guanylyltransferase
MVDSGADPRESVAAMANTYAVIMAGGSGTRFWPASRQKLPKQLLPLDGGDVPLLAATVRRLAPLVKPEHVLVVTAERLRAATLAACPELLPENVLAEPAARNTAPCVAWAAQVLAARDPEARVVVLPSDHAIADPAGFRAAIEEALTAADAGFIATIGIVPTRAETGYGYIELGNILGNGAAGNAVARFVEKPKKEVAEEYVASGKYLWNAGMFFFRASVMVDAVARHLPSVADGVAKIVAARGTSDEEALLQSIFPTLESVSIDVGVMEKEAKLAVVPGSFGWNDIGSWLSAWELAAKDEQGNAADVGSFVIDGERNLLRSYVPGGGKTITVIGASDLVVVETENAILVLHRDKAQDVKKAVELLTKHGRTELL